MGDYFKELQLSEGRGTGIPTIQDELRKNGSSPAVIETNDDRTYFLIEIPCREGFEKTIEPLNETLNKALNGVLNDKEFAIFMEIVKSPNIKRKTLLEKMDITIATLARAVKQLSSEPLNLIEYKGSKRLGGYVLTEKGESLLEDNTMIL